ncbi:MAG: hypothetical protein CMJ32_07970 [Phycisphaerae bacterium]|nr:hypothetical protein [Phycisphaerae bacterium]
MPTVRQTSAVFDGTAGQGQLQTEPYLPPDTEAYRVVSFRISLYLDQIAAADIPSSITFRNTTTLATETLLFAPTIATGDLIAWDYPCDLISPRETEIIVTVNNGAALPASALLLWDFQITAPTRGGTNG